MDKLERYIEHVVNDLVSKTDVFRYDYDSDRNLRINFPFEYADGSFERYGLSKGILVGYKKSHSLEYFKRYVTVRYGVRDSEIQIIWELYKERILSLITNG